MAIRSSVHHEQDRRGRGRRRVALAGVLAAGSGILATAVPAAAAPRATTVTVAHNKTWGTILVLANGDSLYRLAADPANRSVCSGQCAKVWPPVLLAAGQSAAVGHHVKGLGSITRSGGARQVTYKGVPLYLFVGDRKAGQATGNIKDQWGQWWVVNPSKPRAVPTAAAPASHTPSPSTSVGSGGGVAY